MHIQIAHIGFLGVLLETLLHPVTLATRKEGIWNEYKSCTKVGMGGEERRKHMVVRASAHNIGSIKEVMNI